MRGDVVDDGVMLSRLATSSVQAFAVPPFATISAATACVRLGDEVGDGDVGALGREYRAVARPMPLAAPVTRTVNPATDRLSCLKSDMNGSRNDVMRVTGLTRLAPIRRQVKPSETKVQRWPIIPALQIRRLAAC